MVDVKKGMKDMEGKAEGAGAKAKNKAKDMMPGSKNKKK